MSADYYFPLLIGAAVFLPAWAVMSLFGERRSERRIRSRVDAIQAAPAGSTMDSEMSPLEKSLSYLGDKLGPRDRHIVREYRERLSRAGYDANWAPGVFWGVRVVFALAGGVGCYMLRYAFPEVILPNFAVFVALCGAYLCFLLPGFWLTYKTRVRMRQLTHELPEALDLMVVCVEAGMGLDQTLSRVAKDMQMSCRELSKELHRVGLELLAGQGRADVLRNFAKRTGVKEFESLVTLIVQSETLGTSIARTFRVYSDTLRVKRFQAAEEVAGKLPVKLLLPLIFFIMPILFVIMLGPASIRVMGIFAR